MRIVELTGAGEVFCAGADLSEMQAQAQASEGENLAHAEKLASLLGVLDSLAKPTLARVNGDGYGGALGLLGACDIVVAVDTAKFAFTEVRLGIIPAVVSPFVLGKIGESAARRYFLTAEPMSAATLRDIGLVHEVVAADELDARCAAIIDALLKGAPQAMAEAKALIREIARTPRAGTRRCLGSHGRAFGTLEGWGRGTGRLQRVLRQAQAKLAPMNARRDGRPCPSHAQIPWPSLEGGVRGLSTW